jgi:CRISPR-associated protein Cmr6
MAVYTTTLPENKLPEQAIQLGAPELLYRKWQAYDRFEAQKKAFDTKDSRPEYYNNVIKAVKRAFQSPQCQQWLTEYEQLLTGNLACQKREYTTQWRLLVGYATNPTLESGVTLHHIYGFPYIPGSAVKGLLHHVAEMELMETYVNKETDWEIDKINSKHFESDPPAWLDKMLDELADIREMFGSIHLEQAVHPKDKKLKVGPQSPKAYLEALFERMIEANTDHAGWKRLQSRAGWKRLQSRFSELTKDHTGAMLCCYDAVPVPDSRQLLQTDILNPHYQKYYEEKEYENPAGHKHPYPPSDDQSPNPVTFLAVSPGIQFQFYYRIIRNQLPTSKGYPGRHLEKRPLIATVDAWLEKALTEYGIGAKTAAGYGYFKKVSDQSPPNGSTTAVDLKKSIPLPDTETAPEAREPQPHQSKTNPGSKLKKISKPYGQELWKKLAENPYIRAIEGIKANAIPFNSSLPAVKIDHDGKKMTVYYQREKFYCTVALRLEEIRDGAEAQWLWENIIKPSLVGETTS